MKFMIENGAIKESGELDLNLMNYAIKFDDFRTAYYITHCGGDHTKIDPDEIFLASTSLS